MGKPKMYGMVKPAPAMGHGTMERMWQRRLQKQRNREKRSAKLVAAQIAKEKEEK